jgi:hypothetical protein
MTSEGENDKSSNNGSAMVNMAGDVEEQPSSVADDDDDDDHKKEVEKPASLPDIIPPTRHTSYIGPDQSTHTFKVGGSEPMISKLTSCPFF